MSEEYIPTKYDDFDIKGSRVRGVKKNYSATWLSVGRNGLLKAAIIQARESFLAFYFVV